MKKKIVVLCLCLVVCLGVVCACGNEGVEKEPVATSSIQVESGVPTIEEVTVEEETVKVVSFNTPFMFNGLELTLGDKINIVYIDNKFSDLDGQPVLEIPLHVKNNGNKVNHLNMFSYKPFGSKGIETSNFVGGYFDNDCDNAGDLRPGAEYDTFMHILYDGDGTYYIDFDNFGEFVEVELSITIK